jgi:membrane-bound lytic murein transglycosylase B
MPRLPQLPRPKLPRPKLALKPPHLPRPRRLKLSSLSGLVRAALRVRPYQAGALWALVALAALAALPRLTPGPSAGQALGNGAGGRNQQEEAAARYQAWLRGRAASRDAEAARAAARQAAAGAGVAAGSGTLSTPTAADAAIPAMALHAYKLAESWASGFDPGCDLSWSVLAGIGRIESNHGRHFGGAARFSAEGDVTPTILGPVLNGTAGTALIRDTDGGRWDGDRVWDRAVGPMQFIPSTWRTLGRDGNDDGVANPNNLFDAAVSAAGYLCVSGGGSLAEPASLRQAIFAYNHSEAYVNAVLSWANFYQQRAGEGSLTSVQVPSGPSSSDPGPGGVATTPGGGAVGTVPTTPGTPATPGTRPPSTRPTTSTAGGSTSSTAPSTTGEPTTTAPPGSSSTTSTEPPTSTTECPGSTTTSSSTSSTTSTTTTTTTTTSSTTTTTTIPCQSGQ